MVREFDVCIDGMHETAAIQHAQRLVLTHFDAPDILFEARFALAVLRERGNGRTRKILGSPDGDLFVGLFLLVLDPICYRVDVIASALVRQPGRLWVLHWLDVGLGCPT